MIAKSGLELPVHGGVETFFSSTANADYTVK
jgi:hypothetical protein